MESITLADQTTINTANELFDAIHTNSFYKLSTGFYPFVFTYVCPRWHFEMADAHSGLRHFLNKIWYTLMLQDGVCVAHGLDDVHVGSTLPQAECTALVQPPSLGNNGSALKASPG